MSTPAETPAPTPSRPHIPGYGIPDSDEGTLPWSHLVERLTQARNYWVATTSPAGRPHAMPVWGVWVAGALYFSGGAKTRWVRNLTANPQITVHLESGDDVVIIEGSAEQIADPDDPRIAAMDDAYEAKYAMRVGAPIWSLRPQVAFAWTAFPATTTRWVLSND